MGTSNLLRKRPRAPPDRVPQLKGTCPSTAHPKPEPSRGNRTCAVIPAEHYPNRSFFPEIQGTILSDALCRCEARHVPKSKGGSWEEGRNHSDRRNALACTRTIHKEEPARSRFRLSARSAPPGGHLAFRLAAPRDPLAAVGLVAPRGLYWARGRRRGREAEAGEKREAGPGLGLAGHRKAERGSAALSLC